MSHQDTSDHLILRTELCSGLYFTKMAKGIPPILHICLNCDSTVAQLRCRIHFPPLHWAVLVTWMHNTFKPKWCSGFFWLFSWMSFGLPQRESFLPLDKKLYIVLGVLADSWSFLPDCLTYGLHICIANLQNCMSYIFF